MPTPTPTPAPLCRRLKSVGGNKTIDSLLELDCPRRVLLTGTPVQNNLQVRVWGCAHSPACQWVGKGAW